MRTPGPHFLEDPLDLAELPKLPFFEFPPLFSTAHRSDVNDSTPLFLTKSPVDVVLGSLFAGLRKDRSVRRTSTAPSQRVHVGRCL